MNFLSGRLRGLRAEKGKTQEEAAADLGVSRDTYSKWENGRQPSYGVLRQIAGYYEVTIDYLLGESENRRETTEPMIAMGRSEKNKVIKEVSEIIAQDLFYHFEKLLENIEILMERRY